MTKTKQQISFNMSRVRNKNSKIEILLKTELENRGLKFCANTGDVFGHPDIAFLDRKIAVFCDSEFWHGFNWEEKKNEFKSNRDFWLTKIERNMNRDREVNAKLTADGWTILRFWGRDIKSDVSACADKVEEKVLINGQTEID